MTLQEWFDSKDITDKQAADFFGISRSVFNRVRRNERNPTFNHVIRIWIGTKGRVNLKGWVTDEERKEIAEEIGVKA